MPTYARIDGEKVVELFTPQKGMTLAQSFPPNSYTWVDCTDGPGVAQGWTYSGGAFAAPPAPPAPAAPTTITPLAFLGRFTTAEQTAIAGAAQGNATVMLWMMKMAASQTVDLADPQTGAGLDALVAGGLLPAARKTAILTP